jgi:glycosyltransferase involved in cell wall biosynthesis
LIKEIDIVVPCYFEKNNMLSLLNSLSRYVISKINVIICYDEDSDDTLEIKDNLFNYNFKIVFIKNYYTGLHGAVRTGLENSTAPIVIVMPADDDYNADLIDKIKIIHNNGADVVCPSRFLKTSTVKNYPKFKLAIVRIAAFLMYRLAFVPTSDPTNGFRSFSRKVLKNFIIESRKGGTYSIELLAKSHRAKYNIKEIPAKWIQRKEGLSKFKLFNWIPFYLKWFFYSFATTYLRRKKI